MSFLERFLEASTGSPPDRQLKRRRRFWLGCGLAGAVQSRFVLRVVVLPAVLPAAEGNAHPFVCQRPYGRMVRFVFVVALRAVIGYRAAIRPHGAICFCRRVARGYWPLPSHSREWIGQPTHGTSAAEI